MDDYNYSESWMLSILLFLADIPRYHGCSSWRLVLLWYLDPILLVSMIGFCAAVGSVPMVYLLYTQLLFGAVLFIACLLYIPLDESAQEIHISSPEGQMKLKQDFIGKFLCIDIALWMLLWSLFYWIAMPIFIGMSYASFKLSIVHLLHLQSFWDSHLPEVQYSRVSPGSSQKKSGQDTPFFVRPSHLYLIFTDQSNFRMATQKFWGIPIFPVQFPGVSPAKKFEQDTPSLNGSAK